MSAARYAATLRAVSVTESPPNFSRTASASTSATMASATTPAAGTAHTSERWLMAWAGSPVATSTVRSDVCAVPAAGVVAEAMVALVLADAVLEKFGGDSVAETARNVAAYRAALVVR